MSTKTVTPQITDSVTQANVKVVGEAPAMAIGSLMQTTAHSLGMAFENACNAQNQTNITMQAATTQGVMTLYSVDTAATSVAFAKQTDDS